MDSTSTRLKRASLISIIAMCGMLLLYALTSAGYMGDNPVGRGGTYEAPLIVPAGYAFSIWSIIYLGLIVFPVYQLVKRKEGHLDWKKIHGLYAINVICNGLWLAAASYDWLWISVGIIVVMLITLYKINQLLNQRRAAGDIKNYWIEHFPMSVYFAWITLATALNVSSALDFYNWSGLEISPTSWTLAIMSVAAVIAFLVYRRFGEAAYPGVVVWAFIALYIKHQGLIPSIAMLSIIIAIIFVILTIGGIRRQVS